MILHCQEIKMIQLKRKHCTISQNANATLMAQRKETIATRIQECALVRLDGLDLIVILLVRQNTPFQAKILFRSKCTQRIIRSFFHLLPYGANLQGKISRLFNQD